MSLPIIPTRVARAGVTEHWFCGHRVLGELAGNETAMGMLGLAIGGRRLDPNEREALDHLSVVITMADPRIWPLKISRLVSAYGRAAVAVGAANLYQDQGIIGPAVVREAGFLLEALGREVELGGEVEQAARRLVNSGIRLGGFGVPMRPVDERLAALVPRIEALGRTKLKYWRFMQALTPIVKGAKDLEPNIAIGAAALMMDMGMSPKQASLLTLAMVQASFFGNALEGAEQAPEVLRRLPDEFVTYLGRGPRRSPRFERAHSKNE
ncbi:MAG: hypothetical protein HY791_17325 [Deltaproteobacteria bacterium]|nr:hypothetical protein [Deltaproteobacteria bacterium]